MPLYRVHAYDDEHYATLVIRAETPELAGRIAQQFVADAPAGEVGGVARFAEPRDDPYRAPACVVV